MLKESEIAAADKLLSRAEELAKQRYQDEMERENSILSQASNMQTAVSVSSAALFMLLPTIIDEEYRGNLSLTTIYAFVSVIAGLLMISLLLAIVAQGRKKRKMVASMEKILDEVQNPVKLRENLENPFAMTLKIINSYKDAYDSLSKNNNQRVAFVRISMWLFYLALVVCAVFYFISNIIIFQ